MSELKDDDITLLIVGTGNYESYLKKVCHQLGLDNTVTFYGYCPRERLSQLYNKADVFILPSLAESFGIVFAEAMACGLPVIGGRTGGVPDLVKEDNGILVNPSKIDDITNAIITLKTNSALREKMGITNRKKVVDAYSWYNVAQSYLSIYRAAIDS